MKSESGYIEFSNPRIAGLYDKLNPFGDDSEFFCRLAKELGAKTIIDLGCGTGLLSLELAKRGYQVTGIEPSEQMLALAREKPHANNIQWIQGSFEKMAGLQADMVLMTSHVAQFFLDEKEWRAMLQVAFAALPVGGHLVFDIRRLTKPPFIGWPTENNRSKFEDASVGVVESWHTMLEIKDKLVRYELHYFFKDTGEHIVSINTLVFRTQEEITDALTDAGFTIKTVYGNWDGSPSSPSSPEMIFIAKRC
jgi:SAM-dependent methyltransferase